MNFFINSTSSLCQRHCLRIACLCLISFNQSLHCFASIHFSVNLHFGADSARWSVRIFAFLNILQHLVKFQSPSQSLCCWSVWRLRGGRCTSLLVYASSKHKHDCWFLMLMMCVPYSDIFEVRAENILAMSSSYRPIVDYQIRHYLLRGFLPEINIFSDVAFPVTVSLNPITHATSIWSCMSNNSVRSDIISMILRCSG